MCGRASLPVVAQEQRVSMHFNLINLTQKVYSVTGNHLSKDNPIYLLCSMVEESKLSLHQEIYNTKVELSKLNQSLNDCRHLIFNINSCVKIKSDIDAINRGQELVFVHLKQILSPHWRLYWSEGCTDLDIIFYWLERAEKDNYQKINTTPNSIFLNDERFLD